MGRPRIGSIIWLLVLLLAAPAKAEDQFSILALTNAKVIDGVSDRPIRAATVIVRDGEITSVTTGRPQIPPGAAVIDLTGKWLLPGLIDAHVHLPDMAAARRAVASGVTTVRTGGGDHFLDVGIRELNHAGVSDLPDVVAAGYQVVRRPAELFFVDFPKLNNLMNGISGPVQVGTIVAALAGRGANVIKVLATERLGLPETDPHRRMLSDEEIAAAVEAARKAGIPVMAHAHSDDGIVAAVRAGARSIEHGSLASQATISLMRQRGTFLVPTVAGLIRNQTVGGPRRSPIVAARMRQMLPHVQATIARARKAGVRIAAGSDDQYSEPFRLQDEVAELVRQGLSPMEGIKAATSLAAECLLVHDRTGAIKPGLEADLLVLGSDPILDIRALKDVVAVVNNGKVAVDRLTQ